LFHHFKLSRAMERPQLRDSFSGTHRVHPSLFFGAEPGIHHPDFKAATAGLGLPFSGNSPSEFIWEQRPEKTFSFHSRAETDTARTEFRTISVDLGVFPDIPLPDFSVRSVWKMSPAAAIRISFSARPGSTSDLRRIQFNCGCW
jgi:hypothetical protein